MMTNPNRIDVHQHVVPPCWRDALPQHGGDPSGWRSPDWSPDSALRFMNDNQIACGILSLTAPGVTGWQGKAAATMATRVNEYTAGLAQKHPTRFGVFITLPLPDIDASLAEVAYAFDSLHADGVVLLSNYHGVYLGDTRFTPLWQELNRRAAVVFIHPAKPPIPALDGLPGPIADYPMDTTRTALHMVMQGVMRRYSAMKVILAHAGGFVPYAAQRFAALLPGIHPHITQESILADLQTFYFDTALSGSHVTLKSLLAFASPGHVLYGSDFPYAPVSVSRAFTREQDSYGDCSAEEHARINRGNALQLFTRLA